MEIKIYRNSEPYFIAFYSEEDIENNADLLKEEEWRIISGYAQQFSDQFIDKFKDHLIWIKICTIRPLKEEFIRRFQDHLDWDMLIESNKLSETMIEEFSTKLNWDLVGATQHLSEPFMKRHIDKFNLGTLTRYQDLSESFIEEFYEKIDWMQLSCNRRTKEKVLRKHLSKLLISHVLIARYPPENISNDFLREILQNENNYKHLKTILQHQRPSEEIIRENVFYFDNKCWELVSTYQNVSLQFLEEYQDRIDFQSLSYSHHLTLDKVKRFKDQLIPYIENVINKHSELKDFFVECLLNKIDDK